VPFSLWDVAGLALASGRQRPKF